MLHETDEIAPISAIALLKYMASKPSMCVCGVEEIDLPPGEGSTWFLSSLLGTWLHTTDITGQDDILGRLEATLAAQYYGNGSKPKDHRLEQHFDSVWSSTGLPLIFCGNGVSRAVEL